MLERTTQTIKHIYWYRQPQWWPNHDMPCWSLTAWLRYVNLLDSINARSVALLTKYLLRTALPHRLQWSWRIGCSADAFGPFSANAAPIGRRIRCCGVDNESSCRPSRRWTDVPGRSKEANWWQYSGSCIDYAAVFAEGTWRDTYMQNLRLTVFAWIRGDVRHQSGRHRWRKRINRFRFLVSYIIYQDQSPICIFCKK